METTKDTLKWVHVPISYAKRTFRLKSNCFVLKVKNPVNQRITGFVIEFGIQ